MKRFWFLAWGAWLGAVLALGALPAAAQSFQVISAQQPRPGHVVATVAVGGATLKASDVALRLGADGEFLAEKVDAAPSAVVPVSLLLCLDQSGSMGPAAVKDMKTALTAVFSAAPAQLPYRLSIMAFDSQTVPLLPLSNQTARIAPAIARLKAESGPAGKTKLFDAIAGSLATLRAESGVKRLIVVSDGKDEGSTLTAEQLGKLALLNTAMIDAIAYGTLAGGHSGSLSDIAGAANGRFVSAGNAKELGDALLRLTRDLAPASSYNVDFRYTPAPTRQVIESPTLVYKPEGPSARPYLLNVAVAAPAAPAASVAPTEAQAAAQAAKPADKERDGGFSIRIYLDKLVRIVTGIPSWVAWIGAALLVLAAILLLMKRRPLPPVPAPVVAAPLPPTAVTVNPPKPPAPEQRPRRPGTVVGHMWMPPRPGRPTATLRGVSGSSRGAEFPIDRAAYRIGSAPDNDLVLVGDDFASGQHALIRFEADGLYVEDLNSLNGSFLNGQPFKGRTRALAPNDEVRFGRTTFLVLPGVSGPDGGAGRIGGPGFEPSPR